jgi:hypothetical protein
MTKAQKKWSEIPLLILAFWMMQSLEISMTTLPWNLGALTIFPPLLAYIAYTRGWQSTGVLAYLFSFVASSTAGSKGTLFIVSQVWATLFSKVLTSAFNLEGRSSFVVLCAWFIFFQKMVLWSLLNHFSQAPALGLFFLQSFVQVLTMGMTGWLLYPIFVKWDLYFEHLPEEDADGLK